MNLCLWIHFHQMGIHHFLKQMNVLASIPPVLGSRLLNKSSNTFNCLVNQSNLIQRHNSKACFGKSSWVVFPGIKNGHCMVLYKVLNMVKVPLTIDCVTNFCYHLDYCTGTELSQDEFRAWNLLLITKGKTSGRTKITQRYIEFFSSFFIEFKFCLDICLFRFINFIESVHCLCLLFSLALNVEIGKDDPKW